MDRAIVFIDGNNFYHGMRRLNLNPNSGFNYAEFSKKLIGNTREWLETRYYIGQVQQKGNSRRYQEQRKFLARLTQQDNLACFLGRLEQRRPEEKTAKKLRRWLKALPRRTEVAITPSLIGELQDLTQSANKPVWVEKAVDVMIATDMVTMAYKDEYDAAYLISADGDFTPAVKAVKESGKKVYIASPLSSAQLAAVSVFIPLERDFFHNCWL